MVQHGSDTPNPRPLESLDEWEDHLKDRYPEQDAEGNEKPFKATDPDKKKEQFRNYEADARPTVREFYRLNHTYQTLDFARAKRDDFTQLNRREMSLWEAMEFLNTLVDDSDPDTDLSQLDHLLQTAEQIRKDGHPRWFVLTGLLHDLGKVLCLFGEAQWAVVGDTFPLGCRFSDKIVFPQFFESNPDSKVDEYQTECGIYEPGCGLDNVTMSWGHDEYLYHIVKHSNLPDSALYMIRYHSFYPWHREEAYMQLTNEKDRENLKWVREFNPYDLYTKSHDQPKLSELKPYYDGLINEFLPGKLNF